MTERLAFITACLNRAERIRDICDRFGISEKTGHKWLKRFREADPARLVQAPAQVLADRSHAPRHQRHRMAPEVAERILALRRQYPRYGPVKLRDWLVQQEPGVRWPAASSIGALLGRAQLVPARHRRAARHGRLAGDRTEATASNVVWTADFKGEARLGARCTAPYCYPLTVLDRHTRFLLGCTALSSTAIASTRRVFVHLFRTYGLPEVIRTDNGVPFAQPNALGRLGALAYWWIRLGIRPEHITPGMPAENGAHERFHKTLKTDTMQPPATSFAAQQARYDDFRTTYNTERPHASLAGHVPPGTLYTASVRPYPARLPTIGYPAGTVVRLVDAHGVIKWQRHAIFLSSNLAGQYVGLTETDADLVTIAYATLALGDFDSHTSRFTPRVRWLGDSRSE